MTKKYMFNVDGIEVVDKNYYHDSRFIETVYIESTNMDTALKGFLKILEEEYYINVSDNALKNKKNMYIGDCVQVGYVITTSTYMENGDGRQVKKYMDLWLNIKTIDNPFINEEVKK